MWRAGLGGLVRLLGRRRRPGRDAVGRRDRRCALLERGHPPRAARMAQRARGRPRDARSRGCATSRRARARRVVPTLVLPAAGRPRLLHRRLLAEPEPDEGHPRRRAQARLTRSTGSARRRRRRTPRSTTTSAFIEPQHRAHRRPGEPRRRLPGRLAGDDLRRAASRARPHADDRGRARSTSTPATRSSTTGSRRSRAASATSPSTAGSSSAAAACCAASTCSTASSSSSPRTRSPSTRSCSRTCTTTATCERYRAFEDLVQAHAGHPGRLLPVDRRAPVPRQRARAGRARDRRRDRRPRPHRRARCSCWPARSDHITPPAQVFALADHASHAGRRRHDAHDVRRPPRPVHGRRGAARALAADPRRGLRALARRCRPPDRRAARPPPDRPRRGRPIPAP